MQAKVFPNQDPGYVRGLSTPALSDANRTDPKHAELSTSLRSPHAVAKNKPFQRRLWRGYGLAVVVLALWSCLSGVSANSLAQMETSAIAERSLRGILAVQDKKSVAAENPQQLFVPASVLKLVVTTAALHYLGPDHRRVTVALGSGPINQGVLQGDLVLVANGDPTWNKRFYAQGSRQALRALASQVRAHGIERVTGNLILDVSRFPGPNQPASRPQSERAVSWGAPTSAAALAENSISVRIGPGKRIGDPGEISYNNHAVHLQNEIVTVGKHRYGRGNVGFHPGDGPDRLTVHGEYPINEPSYWIRVSLPSPEHYVIHAFHEVLVQEGIDITGKARVSRQSVKTEGQFTPLGRLESPPLSEWLEPILSHSKNWYAEMLLRILALEQKGEGRIDLGLDVEREFLETVVGIAPNAFYVDDASGLSPYNLLAADAVVALLSYALDQPWRGTFMKALAKPGKGTLKRWPKGLPLRAKTGTIQHTVSLAGYLNPESPHPIVFAVFLNHWPEHRRDARSEVLKLVQHWKNCTGRERTACASWLAQGESASASGS